MSDQLAWSDRVRLDQIGKGLHRHLEATEAARSRIAEALDLAALPSLLADVEVRPAGAGWRLKGDLVADVIQTCGITLEPLANRIEASFSVDLIEASDFEPGPEDLDIDPEAPQGSDIIADGGVDLAAYVVEHLALSIDPWPRKPGAVFEAPEGPAEPSPFDVLRELKPR